MATGEAHAVPRTLQRSTRAMQEQSVTHRDSFSFLSGPMMKTALHAQEHRAAQH